MMTIRAIVSSYAFQRSILQIALTFRALYGRSSALPLLQRAFEETFGANANQARLQDLSGFEDVVLSSLMEQLHDELFRPKASPLRVQGLAQIMAVHLAQNY